MSHNRKCIMHIYKTRVIRKLAYGIVDISKESTYTCVYIDIFQTPYIVRHTCSYTSITLLVDSP